MSRKAKGSGFKMRSGNSTPFKHMGSSPVKYTNPATGESLNPSSPDVIQNLTAMGVGSDVIEQMIREKTEKEKGEIDAGTKITAENEIKTNISEVEEIKKVKPKKTKMEKLRDKQKRSSKGQSEYQYRQTKEYKDSKKSEQKALKGQETVSSTTSKMVDEDNDGMSDFIQAPKPKVVETSELSFNDVFAKEYKKQGPGGKFDYKGKMYTTDRADDKKENIFEGPMDPGYLELDKRLKGDLTTDLDKKYNENRKVILTDNLNNPIETVEEELKNKGFNFGDDKFDYSSPIEKKSPYKKGLGKYAKKAKGKRGYKMKRK